MIVMYDVVCGAVRCALSILAPDYHIASCTYLVVVALRCAISGGGRNGHTIRANNRRAWFHRREEKCEYACGLQRRLSVVCLGSTLY